MAVQLEISKSTLPSPAGQGRGSSPSSHSSPRTHHQARSVFHANLRSPKEYEDCSSAVISYLNNMTSFCGAGTHTAALFSRMMGDMFYGEAAHNFEIVCQEIEDTSKREASELTREFESIWDELKKIDSEKNERESKRERELIAKGFERLLQLHCQFFLSSYEALADYLRLRHPYELLSPPSPNMSLPSPNAQNSTTQSSIDSGIGAELTSAKKDASHQPEQVSGRASGNQRSREDSTTRSESCSSNDDTTGLNSKKRFRHGGLRKHIAHFLQRLGRSNSTSEISQSSFYVDIKKEEPTMNGADPELGASSIDPIEKATEVVNSGAGQKGSMPSCDDINAVISLLTCGSTKSTPVPTPSATTSKPLSALSPKTAKAVGSHLQRQSSPRLEQHQFTFNMTQNPSNITNTANIPGQVLFPQPGIQLPNTSLPPPNAGLHQPYNRHSDSLIPDSFQGPANMPGALPGKEQKTNSWPFRPQSQNVPQSMIGTSGSSSRCDVQGPFPTNLYDNSAVNDHEYMRYQAAVHQMKQGETGDNKIAANPASSVASMLISNPTWANTNHDLQKGWPAQVYNGGWCAADSNSNSDESSNGTDAAGASWSIVGGIDPNLHANHARRRHSSGEEGFPTIQINGPNDTRPRSVEDLLEPRQGNLWSVPNKPSWTGVSGKPPLMPKTNVPNQLMDSQYRLGVNGRGSNMQATEGSMQNTFHSPVAMQWSDPLATRQMTAWGNAMSAQNGNNFGPAMNPLGLVDQNTKL